MNIKSNLLKVAWYLKVFGTKRLIYSAGMPRSGSTLLFNMLRLMLASEYKGRLSVGWVEEVDELSKNDVYLIKTHHLNRMGIWRAYRSFYTYRDIRDVLVSRLRKFDKEPDIGIARYYISQYEVAKKNGVDSFKYEDFTNNPLKTVKTLSEKLNINVDPGEIINQLPNPGKVTKKDGRHAKSTLLHKNHITGTEEGEWRDVLSREMQDQLHTEFKWWFEENGYSTDKYNK